MSRNSREDISEQKCDQKKSNCPHCQKCPHCKKVWFPRLKVGCPNQDPSMVEPLKVAGGAKVDHLIIGGKRLEVIDGQLFFNGDMVTINSSNLPFLQIDGQVLTVHNASPSEATKGRSLEKLSTQSVGNFSSNLYFNGQQVLTSQAVLPSCAILNDKPIKGMNYQPTPSDFTSVPPPFVYGDSDFWNQDFPALWGTTTNDSSSNAIPRNDLGTMQTLGINLIKGYNYADPNNRNHTPFLNSCQNKNIKVIVPLSNFFINPTNVIQFADVIKRIITEAINYPAVIALTIGNELNGVPNAEAIAQAFKFVVDLDTGKKLACCSPLQIFDESGKTFPAMATDIRNAINSLGGSALLTAYNERWFQAVNIYPPTPIETFIQTHQNDPVNGQQPLLFTEYGYWSQPTGETVQSTQIVNQATDIYSFVGTTYPLFMGGCLFELTDELWKTGGFGDAEEKSFGIEKFTSQFATDMTQTSNLPYRVDVLAKKTAFNAFAAVL